MNRSISIKRLYSLTAYNNLTVEESISYSLPPNLALDDDLVNNLYYMQMLKCEENYNRYLLLLNVTKGMPPEEVIQYVKKEQAKAFDVVQNLLNSQKEQ